MGAHAVEKKKKGQSKLEICGDLSLTVSGSCLVKKFK